MTTGNYQAEIIVGWKDMVLTYVGFKKISVKRSRTVEKTTLGYSRLKVQEMRLRSFSTNSWCSEDEQ